MSLIYITFAIFFISTLPQLQQTIQTGETRDLNWLNLVLNILGNALLVIHGYLQGDKGVALLGGYFVIYMSTLLYYKSKENRQ
jgi:uncharacterized protein with PQ loop repeat